LGILENFESVGRGLRYTAYGPVTMPQDRLVSPNPTDIAAASTVQILGELLALPDDMQAKQWVAIAGLDPHEHQT